MFLDTLTYLLASYYIFSQEVLNLKKFAVRGINENKLISNLLNTDL